MWRNNSVQQLCIIIVFLVYMPCGLTILTNNNNGSTSTFTTRVRHKTFVEVMDALLPTSESTTTGGISSSSPSIITNFPTPQPPPVLSVLESIRLKCTLSISSPILDENCAAICDGARYLNVTRRDNATILEKVTNALFTVCSNTIESLTLSRNPNVTDFRSGLFEHIPTLKQLNLSENRITDVPNDAFRGAHLLATINLSTNAIESVATDAFKKLHKLMVLDLSANKLKQISVKVLQDTTSLSQLLLGQNSFTDVELHLTSRTIQLIDISDNNLTTLTFKTPAPKKSSSYPRNLSNVTLVLDGNRLSNLTISPALHIYELSLARNNLQNLDENLTKLRPFLARTLNLEGNKLTYLDSTQLPVSSKLETLKLRGNKLSDLNVEELKSHFSNLNTVTLQENEWTCKDLKRIVTQLEVREIKIRDVDSNVTELDAPPNVHGVKCFDSKHELYLLKQEYTAKLNKITLISVCSVGFLIVVICLITVSSCRTMHRLRSDSLSKSFEIKMMPTENIYEEHVYNTVYSNPTTPTTTL